MRIDIFLWFVRVARTRTLARHLAESGHVRIDGRRIDRAHASVKPGNTLTLMVNDRIRILRVEQEPRRRGPPAEARVCYTDIAVDAAPTQI